MADAKIEPALTPEEWTSNLADVFDGYINLSDGVIDIRIGGPGGVRYRQREVAALIAVLNNDLPDDDRRKITRQTITDIRETALLAEDELAREYGCVMEFKDGEMRERWGNVPRTLLAMIRRSIALADALESYLSPG